MSRPLKVNSAARHAKGSARNKGERGDTLIEVLMALVVLSLTALAVMIAFSTSISASQQHRDLATAHIVMASYSQQAISLMEQPCPTSSFGTVRAFSRRVFREVTRHLR
jgi:prepilin-type N-terminal cleavage/methylation domain-containing protein